MYNYKITSVIELANGALVRFDKEYSEDRVSHAWADFFGDLRDRYGDELKSIHNCHSVPESQAQPKARTGGRVVGFGRGIARRND